MNYKTILYCLDFFICLYALSGINFDKFMKFNKPIEARLIVFILSFSGSYLITNFIIDFIS
jgi:uncharacterized membrane protein YwzB